MARPPSPFRSLEPFEEAQAAAFFARDADNYRLAQVVAEEQRTTLVGPSGCGKSSLRRSSQTAPWWQTKSPAMGSDRSPHASCTCSTPGSC
ncbi:hypothetical protein ABT288_43185 [Streptomyces sp. NPDC001093]|uniref:nSTAND1 domain-containing NTPase n=1 Tax=Streptomyces sp. NPDC001093 TaxID=3154376 RepID=UPI00331B25AA